MAPRGKTPEAFAAQMAQVAPDIELVGAYVNARTKVACRCRACGHEWQAAPNHLLRGAGCPACAGTAPVDPETFSARVACAAPGVELLEGYVNARTRVRCRCRTCGHEWTPYPKGLLQGNACPECARRAATERLERLREERSAQDR